MIFYAIINLVCNNSKLHVLTKGVMTYLWSGSTIKELSEHFVLFNDDNLFEWKCTIL